MQVFKFGGASVKDADGVVNLGRIVSAYRGHQLLIVVSAMGKTTNLLERLVQQYFTQADDTYDLLQQAKRYHEDIVQALFPDGNHPVYNEVANRFVEIEWILEEPPMDPYDYLYDQIVAVGELVSTTIISHYLHAIGLTTKWLDARDYILTDNTHREGRVAWEATEARIQDNLPDLLEHQLLVTQGFIGSTSENFTTTLGREGSDYSAAIFAACLGAESVTIWKDVPGVLNADPKWFDQTELIPELSYLDAIELTYYGATVIHPKTIKPLQNKNITLHVKSFIDIENGGTQIRSTKESLPVPSFIFKVNQVLISILPKDFSFIVEDNLSDIFSRFHAHKIKVNMMHNSAVSFSVSIDNTGDNVEALLLDLRSRYDIRHQIGLELITIRYYNQQTIARVLVEKEIIMELKDSYTCQLLVRKL
ncbi:aspartokinase [Parapedobacter pyrenivorans]|uniref:Aspartokinase n=1 Tax=Parapedobacter pyrenivorans TaxID=1305674 RepID=A0A917HZP0_9SPHI|nr:aspartate kinase [Parapedobacter pyrenivorans]GGG98080.1 aspartokinase [Parapedobacter pyrenivorans]